MNSNISYLGELFFLTVLKRKNTIIHLPMFTKHAKFSEIYLFLRKKTTMQ